MTTELGPQLDPNGPSDSDGLLDLPFDQYGRHRLVQRVAESVRRAHQRAPLDVLDVGGFPCLTPLFLPQDRVLVVDPTAPSAGGSAEKGGAARVRCYVRADGCALPFRAASFDLVVSLDSLEHVPRPRRETYVSELLAASRRYVLLMAPFAQPETVLAEELLAEFVRVVNQEEQPQLREHREYGLPEIGEWERFLDSRRVAYVRFSSGFVHNWLPMMLVKHYISSLPRSQSLHRALDRFYNVTLRESDARPPGYRQGFLISLLGPSAVLDEMSTALAAGPAPDRIELIERMEQLGLLLKLADLHVATRRDDRLREQILAKEQHILNIEHALRDTEAARQATQARADALQAQLDAVRAVVDALRRGRLRRAVAAFAQLVMGVRGWGLGAGGGGDGSPTPNPQPRTTERSARSHD